MPENALELVDVEKSFGPLNVLREVSLAVPPAGCYGLVGDNGAGKSTLLKILSGVYPRDGGDIRIMGKPVDFQSAIDARLAGIEMIYQDLALADELDAASNVFLGREQRRGWKYPPFRWLDHKRMHNEAAAVLQSVGSKLPTDRQVKWLSGGERQLVAVARALEFNPSILLMDEPTAALSIEKVNEVNRLINRLKDRRVAMILVSHRFTDLIQVADTIGVLTHGRIVDEFEVAGQTTDEMTTRIVRLMGGADAEALQ